MTNDGRGTDRLPRKEQSSQEVRRILRPGFEAASLDSTAMRYERRRITIRLRSQIWSASERLSRRSAGSACRDRLLVAGARWRRVVCQRTLDFGCGLYGLGGKYESLRPVEAERLE